MWLMIHPEPRSLHRQASDAVALTFQLLADAPCSVDVQVSNDTRLFGLTGLQKSPDFFSSAAGDAALTINGQVVMAPTSSAATYTLPQDAWDAIRKAVSGGRLYYRVIPAGKPPPVNFSELSFTPYVHVLDPSTRAAADCYAAHRPAHSLPWLKVSGNQIVRGRHSRPGAASKAPPKPEVLRGVNLSGLQHQQPGWPDQANQRTTNWRDPAGITEDVIKEIATLWKARIIRLPVNQDWVLNGVAGYSGLDYLKDIDQVVDWAGKAGMYTLIDLQVLYDGANYIGPMPDNLSLLFWRMLASRYRNDPGVLFDISNEPHHPDDERPKIRSSGDARFTYRGARPAKNKGYIDIWHSWVRAIERVIHDIHPDALLFVSGLDGPCHAASLRSMPVSTQRLNPGGPSLPNVVYSSHIYRQNRYDKDAKVQIDPPRNARGKTDQSIGTLTPTHWDYWLDRPRLLSKAPVFIGEWGGPDSDVAWGTALEQYLRPLHQSDATGAWPGLAGWTAWSWGDDPHLVKRTGRKFEMRKPPRQDEHEPKLFGDLVQKALKT